MKNSDPSTDRSENPQPEGTSFPEPEAALGYRFRNRALLQEALTHRSLINEISEKGRRDNERLEFLGDAVLGLLIAEWIMEVLPEEQEGELTRLRSDLVKEKRLAEVSQNLGLGEHLCLGKGEERMGGRKKPSVLANVFEAILGAIYLDGGMEPARRFVRQEFRSILEEVRDNRRVFTDSKTRVQELLLTLFQTPPAYAVVGQRGPDHDKTFVVELRLKNLVLASGTGKSKKEAEQDAAERFLGELEKNPLGLL